MPGAENLDALRAEVERAAQHYYHSPQQRGIDNRTKRFVIERCERYLKGPRVLELGYVDGEWTDALLAKKFHVDVVEGAAYFDARHYDRVRHEMPSQHVSAAYAETQFEGLTCEVIGLQWLLASKPLWLVASGARVEIDFVSIWFTIPMRCCSIS